MSPQTIVEHSFYTSHVALSQQYAACSAISRPVACVPGYQQLDLAVRICLQFIANMLPIEASHMRQGPQQASVFLQLALWPPPCCIPLFLQSVASSSVAAGPAAGANSSCLSMKCICALWLYLLRQVSMQDTKQSIWV